MSSVNTCPHCGGSPAIPLWRKIFLPAHRVVRCRLCQGEVRVSRYAHAQLLLGAAALYLLRFTSTDREVWILWGGAMLLGFVTQWTLIRVVKK